MDIATEPTAPQQIDQDMILAEIRTITQPRLDIPPMSDTIQRTKAVSGLLRSLFDYSQGDEREAVRVMRRLGTRPLDALPRGEVSPYAAWQRLVNLARCTAAFLDVEGCI